MQYYIIRKGSRYLTTDRNWVNKILSAEKFFNVEDAIAIADLYQKRYKQIIIVDIVRLIKGAYYHAK